MRSVAESPRLDNSYLLVPGTPTPNGGLHLGHVAGPFLKIDVLGRYLRMAGATVHVVSGTDGYESYVSLKAHSAGVAPPVVAACFHRRIEEDLRSLDIFHDAFIDPLEGETRQEHVEWNRTVMRLLTQSGRVITRFEKMPFNPDERRFTVGCWLVGRCPVCDSPAGGYCCEACGAVFSPGELQAADDRLAVGELRWQEFPTLFLQVDEAEITRLVEGLGLAREEEAVIEEYLRRVGPILRLTQPMEWGIGWPVRNDASRSVLFTYTVGQFAFALHCGAHTALSGHRLNPFDAAADVTTVASGGFDNLVANVLGNLGIHQVLPQFRPYDYLLVNRFVNLDGEKFSTSRGHVIWVADIAAANLDPDPIRYYLATIAPEGEVTNFTIEGFVDIVNEYLVDKVQRMTDDASRSALEIQHPGPETVASIEAILARLHRALTPGTFSLHDTTRCVSDWVDDAPGIARIAPYWWLKTMSLLTFPLMPRWAASVWQQLDPATSEPSLGRLWQVDTPQRWGSGTDGRVPRRFKLLNPRAVHAALGAAPATDPWSTEGEVGGCAS